MIALPLLIEVVLTSTDTILTLLSTTHIIERLFYTFQEILDLIYSRILHEEEIFILGGAKIYREVLDIANKLITLINIEHHA